MARQASAETKLKRANRDVRELQTQLSATQVELVQLRWALKCEQAAVAEWKQRFDALLKLRPATEDR